MSEEVKEQNVFLTELENKIMAMQLQVQELQDKVREHNEVLRKFKMLKV